MVSPLPSATPQPSALAGLIDANPAPPTSPHPSHLHHLALQIAHNLRYQHNWTDVRLHFDVEGSNDALPRPLITGVPPQRLYVHPDEQIALLQRQKDEGKTGMPEVHPEREWVLPTHLREKWSLRRFGEVFDKVSLVPTADGGKDLFGEQVNGYMANGHAKVNEWRTTRRVLLATLDDDSTIVYYIVHDGIVKPPTQ
ncbi:hypothetical protein B0A48_13540 [Cryoendolithus antarcticus]|uniref:tRNA-splicing endonuclease subunit Sen15 domain-containing protein n=1 Tax=Cryoendolithus antarcticus TaxID=1507870 RepID=A0A1V8SNX7_9PEZI|nr:hypothetical protein B0A48_13540 [Cryoendolithus antarcticus]